VTPDERALCRPRDPTEVKELLLNRPRATIRKLLCSYILLVQRYSGQGESGRVIKMFVLLRQLIWWVRSLLRLGRRKQQEQRKGTSLRGGDKLLEAPPIEQVNEAPVTQASEVATGTTARGGAAGGPQYMEEAAWAGAEASASRWKVPADETHSAVRPPQPVQREEQGHHCPETREGEDSVGAADQPQSV